MQQCPDLNESIATRTNDFNTRFNGGFGLSFVVGHETRDFQLLHCRQMQTIQRAACVNVDHSFRSARALASSSSMLEKIFLPRIFLIRAACSSGLQGLRLALVCATRTSLATGLESRVIRISF